MEIVFKKLVVSLTIVNDNPSLTIVNFDPLLNIVIKEKRREGTDLKGIGTYHWKVLKKKSSLAQ